MMLTLSYKFYQALKNYLPCIPYEYQLNAGANIQQYRRHHYQHN
jgi:hypothetical protein